MASNYERLALIANEAAEIAAKFEELERLREQVRRAELTLTQPSSTKRSEDNFVSLH
jgi:hypothetical protein